MIRADGALKWKVKAFELSRKPSTYIFSRYYAISPNEGYLHTEIK